MGYSQVALEDKILQMYPEILQSGISPRLSFDDSKHAWAVKFVKGAKSATVFLDKKMLIYVWITRIAKLLKQNCVMLSRTLKKAKENRG